MEIPSVWDKTHMEIPSVWDKTHMKIPSVWDKTHMKIPSVWDKTPAQLQFNPAVTLVSLAIHMTSHFFVWLNSYA
jgi:hypothetical protein